MDENISNLIDEELVRELEKLKSLKPESEEYKKTLDAVKRLHEMKLDSVKIELEDSVKREKLAYDNGRADEEIRLKEAEEMRLQESQQREKKEFWIKTALDTGLVALNLLFFGFQFRKGYRFEEQGTYTSSTFREVRQRAFNTLFKRK